MGDLKLDIFDLIVFGGKFDLAFRWINSKCFREKRSEDGRTLTAATAYVYHLIEASLNIDRTENE